MTTPEPHDTALAHQVGIIDWAQTIQGRFERFHADHPEVYAEIVRLAREWRAASRSPRTARWSIDGAFEVLRWQRHIAADEHEPYRLNNDYRSRYARAVMEWEPDLDGVFDLRELRA